MPFFMDYHQIENLTLEDVKTGHLADLSVQEKYNVKYHQFWVDENAGTVFCLIEAPDKESCAAVHQEAHGGVACALTEVKPAFYNLMMGDKIRIDHGHVQNEDGTVDSGNRSILVASLDMMPLSSYNGDPSTNIHVARKLISEQIIAFNGRQLPAEPDGSLIAVFNEPLQVINCAIALQKIFIDLSRDEKKSPLKIGLSMAQPVSSKGGFFDEAIKLARHLSVVTPRNKIMTASLLSKRSKIDIAPSEQNHFTMLTDQDEAFILKLYCLTEEKLSDAGFTIDSLCSDLCVSRTQLYRKITFLTKQSPNTFVRSIRMKKAIELLQHKSTNISEIAYLTGFNTPSYFTKCFLDKFGCTPSEYIKTTNNSVPEQ